jgi:DNA transposase THAP9
VLCCELCRLFDLMNSRNLLASGYKAPLKATNFNERRQFVAMAESYLSSLTDRPGAVLLINTNRKTGFLGLIVSARSVIGIYDELTKRPFIQRPFLLTYKVSQDHIELLFSVIRSKGGYNNNPTARQFSAAYKRLLVHHEIHSVGGTGNCLALDFTSILHMSGLKDRVQPVVDTFEIRKANPDCEILATAQISDLDDLDVPDPARLSSFVDDVVGYIAGYVCFKLRKTVKCMECQLALTYDCEGAESYLLQRKSRGGLSRAPADVIYLCKRSESCIRASQIHQGIMKRTGVLQQLTSSVLAAVVGANIFQCLQQHSFEQCPEDNHVVMLTKAVVSQYLNIRLHHIATLHNETHAQRRVRHKLTKLILFNHE